MRRLFKNNILVGLICFLIYSCEEIVVPKPLGFMRIEMADQEYAVHNIKDVLSFDLSDQSHIEEMSVTDDAIVFNIVYPYYNAKIHLAYNRVENNLATYLTETRKLTYQHHEKANNIDKVKIVIPEHNVYGVNYNLSGNVASSSQFFVTDSTQNFLRGALYFWSKPNEDSLAPVVKYIREDIDQLISSVEWN